jgi:hypothetical protein
MGIRHHCRLRFEQQTERYTSEDGESEAEVLVSKLVHASGEATRSYFQQDRYSECGVSFEVLPIRCYAGGDTLHLMMWGRMGFASNKCPFCQSNNNSSHSDCSYARQAEPITNELLLEARRDMDLTAAFEELLKRKGRREGYQYRHRVSSQRIHPRAAGGYQGAKELTATMGQIKAASPLLLPSIPICNWIVPTLHILLGIINDIVSRYGAASWQSI